jgi:hypothetical protein
MEIFYCFRCGERVRSVDVQAGAVRFGNRVCCAACAPLVGFAEPLPRASATSAATEAVEPQEPPRRKLLFLAGAAGLAALGVTLAALFMLGSSTPSKAPPALNAAPPGPPAPSDEARLALERAREYAAANPDDLEGRIERFGRVAWRHDGSPAGGEALREVELLRAERARRLEARLRDLDVRLDSFLKSSRWKDARDLIAAERSLDAHPRWTLGLDRRAQALADAERAAAPAPAPPPPPPPSVSEAARAAWIQACRKAFARDFAGAEAVLKEALATADNAPTRRELLEDTTRLAAVQRLYSEGKAALRARPSGFRTALQVWGDKGRLETKTGLVLDTHEEWLVLRPEGRRLPEAVDYVDIAAASWVTDPPKDAEAAALFCLLDGDAATARRLVPAGRLPEKCWTLRPPPGAPRDGLPVSAADERLARRRLAEADGGFGFLTTRADAVLVYRELLEDFGATSTVEAWRPHIRERANGCQEARLAARDLRPSGSFRRSSWTGKNVSVPECWTSTEDVGLQESLENCVEIDFPALPGIRYRCWVYVGGCCLESFSAHFQASEYAAEDPDTGKIVAAPPGGNYAFPLSPKGFFRSRHVQHARKGTPKRPERWQWIEVPLPEFADAGVKTVRLLTASRGFSVACAWVSADRDTPPRDEEALDILGQPEPEIAGAAEPSEWLLFGPLPNRGFGKVDEPQRGVDLSDPEGWVPAAADLRPAGGGRAAVFDFAARWKPNENVVGFALIHVRSPEDRPATLLLGSDDGVEAWLNGTRIHRLDRGRGMKLDEDRVDVELKAGWNRLLIKVYQGKGGWGLGARFVGRSGEPLADLAYEAWGDLPGVLR